VVLKFERAVVVLIATLTERPLISILKRA